MADPPTDGSGIRGEPGIVRQSPRRAQSTGLAGYLLVGIGLAAYLASSGIRYRLLYLAAAGVNLLALTYAENRSTLVGILLGAIVGGVIFFTVSTPSAKRWIAPLLALGLAAVVAAMSVGVRTFPTNAVVQHVPTVVQRLALSNPAGSDESRTMQWRAAIDGFRDRPLLGYGLENHNLVWSAHFNPRIYAIETDIYDRTHNQFLETLPPRVWRARLPFSRSGSLSA